MTKKKKFILLTGIVVICLLAGVVIIMQTPIRSGILRSVFLLKPSDERQMLSGFKDRSIIKFGLAGPLDDIRETNLFLEGADMAVSECNAAGILPVTIVLDIADDRNRIADVLTVAGNFAKNPDVIAVIGHWGSDFSVAASQIYENAEVIMLTPVSTNPKLTEQNFRLIFRNAPTDVTIGYLLADYAENQGYKNIAALYSDDMTGMQVSHSFESRARACGINIIDKHTVYYNFDLFDKKYEKWREDGLSALFIADIITRNKNFRQRMIEKNPSLPILATDAYDYDIPLQSLAKTAKSLHIVTFFNPDSDNKAYTDFCERFEALYKKPPDYWALQGYDSVTTLVEAIRRAGTFDAAAIAKVLKDIENPFQSITGSVISFDERGDVISPNVYIKQIINGKVTFWEGK